MMCRTASMVAAALLVSGMRPAPASAGEPPTLVFAAEGDALPPATTAELTAALMRAATAEGLSPRQPDASLRDAAELLECDPGTVTCLDSVSATMEGRALLAATATPSGDAIAIHLTWYRRGQPLVARDFEVPAGAAAGPALEEEARALLRGGAAPAPPAAAPRSSSEPAAAVLAPTPERTRFSLRRVRPYAWAVAGAGVVLLGTGLVFASKASGLRDDVDEAPRDTVADLEHLQDLEDEGARATSLSSGFLITGGVALAAGAALVIWQGLQRPEERPAVTVAPVPIEGGAALFVHVEVP